MTGTWYLTEGPTTIGPLPGAELSARAADGRLGPADLVSRDGRNWVPARRVPGLTFLSPTTAVHPVDVIPGYEVLGRIGGGAGGVVYRARQLALGREVAVKVIGRDLAGSPEMTARFVRERETLARLRHPNLVQVFDAGQADGRVFYAMELLDGVDLDRWIEQNGPMTEATAWAVGRQAAAALAHAAAEGVLHRDIKPSNLFVCQSAGADPIVKVTDLGLARTPADAGQDRTQVGTLLGTPAYMAPEQFDTSDVDLRADIYALGATLFEAIEGRAPFVGATVWDVMKRKQKRPPRFTRPVSAATAELIAAMMAPQLAGRPATYAELCARIDAILAPTPSAKPAVSRRRPRQALLVAAVALAVGGLAVALRGGMLTPAVVYAASGREQSLFDGQSLSGWSQSGEWEVGTDDEKAPVLTGTGELRHRLPMYPAYRVVVSLDLHQATAAEIDLPAGDSANRPVLRATRAGVAVGTRASPGGAFVPTGETTAYPEPPRDRPSYQEVRWEWAADRWVVHFAGTKLGTGRSAGLATEVRVSATGGAVRVNDIRAEELRPR